eukprot:6177837-Pleurochrysis_carterae.AAC.1
MSMPQQPTPTPKSTSAQAVPSSSVQSGFEEAIPLPPSDNRPIPSPPPEYDFVWPSPPAELYHLEPVPAYRPRGQRIRG